MSHSTTNLDRLLDTLTDPRQWTAPPMINRSLVEVSCTEELSIKPNTDRGPVLVIAYKMDEGGQIIFREQLSLAAVDDRIGKLIKMRDHMAHMKSDNADA